MSRKDMQSDEIEEIMKEMLNDDEYADEGFEDIDEKITGMNRRKQ